MAERLSLLWAQNQTRACSSKLTAGIQQNILLEN